WWLDVILLARWFGVFVDRMGLGSSALWLLLVASRADFAGLNVPTWIIPVAIWFSICRARCCLSGLAPSRPVGVGSSMGLEDLRETVKTMGRLVLADSQEIQELVDVGLRKFEAEQGGLSEQQEAMGLSEQQGGPMRAVNFAASVKWWGRQGNLTKQELTEGFVSLWMDVIMRSTPQQVAAPAPYFRWKQHRSKGKGKGISDDMQAEVRGTDKGMIVYAVELPHTNGPKLSTLLAEAVEDTKAIRRSGAAPPGSLHRQLSRIDEM
ncbi:unnamed protein product, partial [Prorocentrum cordatum]